MTTCISSNKMYTLRLFVCLSLHRKGNALYIICINNSHYPVFEGISKLD